MLHPGRWDGVSLSILTAELAATAFAQVATETLPIADVADECLMPVSQPATITVATALFL